MDKLKPGVGGKRPMKSRGHATPFDLIPLGGKSRDGESSGHKLLAAASKTESVSLAGTSLLAKRPKYSSATVADKSQVKYDEMVIDCHPSDLYDRVQNAAEDSDTTDRLLCGAIKHLRTHRAKPNHQIMLTLITLAKKTPLLFTTDIITGALCNLLKRDLSVNFKAKGNPTVTVLACNLLYASYADEEHWPQQFIEIYLDDSLGERVWVDRVDCKPLVDNIVTAFGTNLTPKNPTLIENIGHILPGSSTGASSSPSHSPFHSLSSDTSEDVSNASSFNLKSAVVKHRYKYQLDSVEQMVMDVITEQMTKRQHVEIASKQLLRLLTAVAGYCAVRLLVVTKLEVWLQNPKLMRAAQDLLLGVCLNSSAQVPNDKDVIVGVLKIRLKNKQIVPHYLSCIRELLENDEENLRVAMTHTIYNELSSVRNQNNMLVLSIMFQQDPDRTPKLLADIFMDLLMAKDDFLRSLRALLREIVRTLRHDFTFHTFCMGLMADRSRNPSFLSLDLATKERVLFAIADLVAVCELLTISPAVREASASTISFSDKRKDITVMQNFWTEISKIQRDAVVWMHEAFIMMLPAVESQAFIQCLYKLLMMAHGEHYSKVDNWPAEAERSLMLRLVSETPVLEDTLIRVIMMGMEGEYPLKTSDALDVMELMINRAAALNTTNYPALEIKSLDMVKLLLAVSAYHHPDNIALPRGYQPPHLAISPMYWKSWLLMLIMAAYNPSTFAKHIWKEYPTLEVMMEMVMTNKYTFPPVAAEGEKERIIADEKKICELEKEEILEFEGHLAAATSNVTITEANSLLLSQLISMNAKGPARRMPPKVIEDLKHLNSTLRLGHMLSKSRSPDFLMQVIQKQGTSEAMPWLAELVESSEGSLDVLPIQCLCEFLLMGSDESSAADPRTKQTQKIARQDRLLQRLQTIVNQTDSESQTAAVEIIKYFFERLYSLSADIRSLSIKAMRQMFVDPVTQQAMDIDIDMQVDQFEWLLVTIPDLAIFSPVEKLIQTSVHKALHVEMDCEVVSAYITYLLESKMYRKEPSETMLEIALVLVSRSVLCDQLLQNLDTYQMLLKACNDFTEDAITRKSAFHWADAAYSVMVQWPSDQTAVLDLRIIHAVTYLLSKPTLSEHSSGQTLLEKWFPSSGDTPVGCMSVTSELADLYSDKLRRMMLQTGNPQLINAALGEVKAKQLMVFFQSFGLPVNAVGAILKHIDAACQSDAKAVEQAVGTQRQYLSQLLETQRLRGVTKVGETFSSLLTSISTGKEAPPGGGKMETESTTQASIRRKVPNRTLSTLESRAPETIGSDTDSFVKNKLCNIQSCREGLMNAQRSLVTNPSLKGVLCTSIVRALSGEDKSKLITNLNKYSALTSALLRLLVSESGSITDSTRELFAQLSDQSSLTPTLRSMVSKAVSHISPAADNKHTADPETSFNQQMVQLCLENKIEEAVKLCNEKLETKQPDSVDSRASLGLIIDWIELLDPEMTSLCSDVQDKLLFGQSNVQPVAGEVMSNDSKAIAGPAYLRSLLTHQSRWSTIKQTIDRLLSADDLRKWSPTAVLDFLAVCLTHPRLYQGREQRKPKKAETENVLCLSGDQAQRVAQLMCTEATSRHGDKSEGPPATIQTERVVMLVRSCVEENVLESVVQYLEVKATRVSVDNSCYRRLLVSLYTHQPKLIQWLGDSSIIYQDITLAMTGHCSLDPEIQAALSTLGTAKAGKKYVVTSSDANLVCRKLAAHHPMLFLRHVSMMNSILSGRSQFTYGEFIHQNYLLLHTHVLGLVELLQPHIFIHKDFPSIIDAYFTVIRVHGHENDDTLAALFIKFIAILCNFFSSLPDLCIRSVSQYNQLLSALQNDVKYNKNPGLKTLATASYMPQAKESSSTIDLANGGFLLPSPAENLQFTNEQLKSTLRKLNKESATEDILSSLNDLDNTSKKVIEVLGKCLDEFKNLIFSLNQQIRDLAFKLITRYCRHNPKVTADFLTPVISCLEHDNTDLCNTALSHVAELALLMCEDDRKNLLNCAFTVASLHNSNDGIKSIQSIMRVVSTNVFAQSS